jgi:DNA helicase-2/ATP-dependent DNA helicase PcrA
MYLLFLSYPLNYLGQPAKKSIFLDEILGKRQPAINKSAA